MQNGMSFFFRGLSRDNALPLFAPLVLALALTGCYTKLGTVASSESTLEQTTTDAPAVSEETPPSDAADRTQSSSTDTQDAVDDFFQDVDHYTLEYLDASDRALVKQATRLLKERSDSEISRSTYRERLNNFRLDHPGFYGNFFGDPLYATYDLRYTRLAELRQRIDTFINPQNSVRSTASFYCSPYSYDPNFGGLCSGLQYTSADFFFLPSGSFDPAQALPSRPNASFAVASRLSDQRATMKHGADSHTLNSEEERPRENAPALLSADASSKDREATLDVPSEIETLSSEEVASLTESVREGLSPQERVVLLQHLHTQRVGPSGRSSTPSRAAEGDLGLRVETIRRASRGQLYGSRSGGRASPSDASDSPFSDVRSSELLDRLERRRGRTAGSATADPSASGGDRSRGPTGRSIRDRASPDSGSSSSGRSVDSSDSDGESSSSGRTGREDSDQ